MAMAEGGPVFVLARESRNENLPNVYTDASVAVEAIGSHLYEKGYRRPIFVAGPKPFSTALKRRRHYREFWSRKGVEMLPEISIGAFDRTIASDALRANLLIV
jgi:LacI family transcriptional regulator